LQSLHIFLIDGLTFIIGKKYKYKIIIPFSIKKEKSKKFLVFISLFFLF